MLDFKTFIIITTCIITCRADLSNSGTTCYENAIVQKITTYYNRTHATIQLDISNLLENLKSQAKDLETFDNYMINLLAASYLPSKNYSGLVSFAASASPDLRGLIGMKVKAAATEWIETCRDAFISQGIPVTGTPLILSFASSFKELAPILKASKINFQPLAAYKAGNQVYSTRGVPLTVVTSANRKKRQAQTTTTKNLWIMKVKDVNRPTVLEGSLKSGDITGFCFAKLAYAAVNPAAKKKLVTSVNHARALASTLRKWEKAFIQTCEMLTSPSAKEVETYSNSPILTLSPPLAFYHIEKYLKKLKILRNFLVLHPSDVQLVTNFVSSTLEFLDQVKASPQGVEVHSSLLIGLTSHFPSSTLPSSVIFMPLRKLERDDKTYILGILKVMDETPQNFIQEYKITPIPTNQLETLTDEYLYLKGNGDHTITTQDRIVATDCTPVQGSFSQLCSLNSLTGNSACGQAFVKADANGITNNCHVKKLSKLELLAPDPCHNPDSYTLYTPSETTVSQRCLGQDPQVHYYNKGRHPIDIGECQLMVDGKTITSKLFNEPQNNERKFDQSTYILSSTQLYILCAIAIFLMLLAVGISFQCHCKHKKDKQRREQERHERHQRANQRRRDRLFKNILASAQAPPPPQYPAIELR